MDLRSVYKTGKPVYTGGLLYFLFWPEMKYFRSWIAAVIRDKVNSRALFTKCRITIKPPILNKMYRWRHSHILWLIYLLIVLYSSKIFQSFQISQANNVGKSFDHLVLMEPFSCSLRWPRPEYVGSSDHPGGSAAAFASLRLKIFFSINYI